MKTVLLIIIIGYTATTNAQVKIWNDEGKKIKTKGTMLTMETIPTETYDVLTENLQDSDFGIAGFTVVGMVLPYLYKIGVNSAKSATAKKEAEYTKEYSSLNSIDLINIAEMADKGLGFICNFDYYKNKSIAQQNMAKYSFAAHYDKDEQYLSISLLKSEETYLPVRTKKKYDLITEVFEFTVVAKVTVLKKGKEGEKDKNLTKIMELGKAKVCRVMPSYRVEGEKPETIFIDGVYMPTHTEDGSEITYHTVSLVCSAKFLNPIGTTQSGINAFFENNSEGIEGLLNLTIKSEE